MKACCFSTKPFFCHGCDYFQRASTAVAGLLNSPKTKMINGIMLVFPYPFVQVSKDWLGYSAQHCQMTVPKLILVFLGSLGEIGDPVWKVKVSQSLKIAWENTCVFSSQPPLSPYYSVARCKAPVLSHTLAGRKFALLEGLSHDLESVPDRFIVSIFRGRCGTVKLSPRFKVIKLIAIPGWKSDQNNVDQRLLEGKGLQYEGSTSITFVRPVYYKFDKNEWHCTCNHAHTLLSWNRHRALCSVAAIVCPLRQRH